jgi:dihydropyrimidinase
MVYDLVIRDGTLVTAAEVFQADVGIHNGSIAAIGSDLSGKNVIDATDKLVIPGGIDPHVHLQMPLGDTTSSDDWNTGTIAAACGGTTTVIDFVEPKDGQSLTEAFKARYREADGRANVDYAFHMTLTRADQDHLSEIPQVIEAGLTSFKTYTTYAGFQLEDREFLTVMTAVRNASGMILAHCENDGIIRHLTASFLDAGHTAPSFHPRSRPAIAEGEAIRRILALAGIVGVPLYIVHISTQYGTQALAAAQAEGQMAYGETCPQYLYLTDERYDQAGFEGAKYVCSPPLRKPEDSAALWAALKQNTLQTVGTDHCPFFFDGQKDAGRERFTAIPGGLPGVELRLALLYEAVSRDALDLNQWVAVTSTNAAKLFGLYPRKGTLAPGADADIVIFDPGKSVTAGKGLLHEHVDYTPYEGMRLSGYPAITIARGEVIVRDGDFVGKPGRGEYLPRKRGG